MCPLESLGWNSFFEDQLDAGGGREQVARVSEEQRGSYRILSAEGEWYAELAGRLGHEKERSGALAPCVGDWVLADLPSGGADIARIHRVFARRTQLSRMAAGREAVEQVIAANVDCAVVL